VLYFPTIEVQVKPSPTTGLKCMIVETKHWFPTDVIILDGPSVIPIAPASFPFWMAPASMALVKVHGTNVFSHGTNVFSAPTSSPHQRLLRTNVFS